MCKIENTGQVVMEIGEDKEVVMKSLLTKALACYKVRADACVAKV